MTPAEVGELTIPQLAILASEGATPNPRKQAFASSAQAERYMRLLGASQKGRT